MEVRSRDIVGAVALTVVLILSVALLVLLSIPH
jgi:hypothetical protein